MNETKKSHWLNPNWREDKSGRYRYILLNGLSIEELWAIKQTAYFKGGNPLPELDVFARHANMGYGEFLVAIVFSTDWSESGAVIANMEENIDKLPKEFLSGYIENAKREGVHFIKHIPHANLYIPPKLMDYVDSPIIFFKNALKMADFGIDRLFAAFPTDVTIQSGYSRVYLDVERYKDDEKEPMAKLGQGYRYSKYYDHTDIYKDFEAYKKSELFLEAEKLYDEYHGKMSKLVNELLERHKKVIMMDVHSYSDELADSLGKRGPYPDVCLGFDEVYVDYEFLFFLMRFIKGSGLSYRLNFPYSGSMVPNDLHTGEDKGEFRSIMIEVNKRVYL